MAEVEFGFIKGDDSPSRDEELNEVLRNVAKRKKAAIKRAGRMRSDGQAERAARVIETANAWAIVAEDVAVLSADIRREQEQLEAVGDSRPELKAQLEEQIKRQQTELEAAAQAEPGLRVALDKLLSPED